MSESWITECWERKNEVGLSATDQEFNKHKQLPFTGCVISLHGFPAQEEQHMREIAIDSGNYTLCNHFGGVVFNTCTRSYTVYRFL